MARRFDGRMVFCPRRDSTIVARRFIAGLAIHRIRVPEGRCDRRLARSAWESATQKSRPAGYGVIRAGMRTDSMIVVTQFRKQKQNNLLYGFDYLPGHTVPYGTVLSRDDVPWTRRFTGPDGSRS